MSRNGQKWRYKTMRKNQNVIPRKFKYIIGEWLVNTSAGKRGLRMKIDKDDGYYHGVDLDNGKEYQVFVEMLRNIESFKVLEII